MLLYTRGIQDFKEFMIEHMLPEIYHNYRKWEGDLIDLKDYDKDEITYAWLQTMPSWLDDVVPAMIPDSAKFIEDIYHDRVSNTASKYRDAIYLYLECDLRELIQEIHDNEYNIQPEPFAGYLGGE